MINMKKLLKVCLCFIFCLAIVVPSFVGLYDNKKTSASVFYGDEIPVKQEIIGVNKDQINSNHHRQISEHQAPYNTRDNTMMPGYSVTPQVNEHKEVKNQSFFINSFSMTSADSIFLWIYFPDGPLENFFSLTLTFQNETGGYIEWKYSPQALYDIMSSGYTQKYGWKLFELCYSDGKKVGTSETAKYIRFSINYALDIEEFKKYYEEQFGKFELDGAFYDFLGINGTLTFYHVFLGSKISEETNILLHLNFTHCKLKDSLYDYFNGLYLDDYLKVPKITEMFDYIYVGKYNLFYTGSQLTNYSFSYTIHSSRGFYEFKEEDSIPYKLKGEGTCNFIIVLKEKRSGESYNIISKTITFDCVKYECGNFESSYFEFLGAKSYTVTFKLKDGFTKAGDLEFSTSNQKIAVVEKVSYSEEHDIYYVTISCLKNGKTDIVATTKGSRDSSNIEDFSATTKVEIRGISRSFFSMPITWVFMGILAVAIAVFIVVTLINYKKTKKLLETPNKRKY